MQRNCRKNKPITIKPQKLANKWWKWGVSVSKKFEMTLQTKEKFWYQHYDPAIVTFKFRSISSNDHMYSILYVDFVFIITICAPGRKLTLILDLMNCFVCSSRLDRQTNEQMGAHAHAPTHTHIHTHIRNAICQINVAHKSKHTHIGKVLNLNRGADSMRIDVTHQFCGPLRRHTFSFHF